MASNSRFIVPNSAAQERVVSLEGAQPFPENTFSTVRILKLILFVMMARGRSSTLPPLNPQNLTEKFSQLYYALTITSRSTLWSTIMKIQTPWSHSRQISKTYITTSSSIQLIKAFRVISSGDSEEMKRQTMICHGGGRRCLREAFGRILTLLLFILSLSCDFNIFLYLR